MTKRRRLPLTREEKTYVRSLLDVFGYAIGTNERVYLPPGLSPVEKEIARWTGAPGRYWENLKSAMKSLKTKERQLVLARFDEKQTYKSIGIELRISAERVRQLLERAKGKLAYRIRHRAMRFDPELAEAFEEKRAALYVRTFNRDRRWAEFSRQLTIDFDSNTFGDRQSAGRRRRQFDRRQGPGSGRTARAVEKENLLGLS